MAKKIRAKIKKAKEITGIKGCLSFSGGDWNYPYSINSLAKENKILEFESLDHSSYDYVKQDGGRLYFKKEWLYDIEEIKEEIEPPEFGVVYRQKVNPIRKTILCGISSVGFFCDCNGNFYSKEDWFREYEEDK